MAFVIGFQLILLAVCGYCLWRGGAPERLASLGCLVAAAATIIVNSPAGPDSQRLEVAVFIIDLLLLAWLVAIALKANRYWPLWASAAHAIAAGVHLAKAVSPDMMWPVYTLFSKSSAILVLLILWVGALRHRRRMRMFGNDPPWRPTSPA